MNYVSAEINKQKNINSIVEKALEQLKSIKKDIDTPEMDTDWLNNFLEHSKFISDSEMQDLWAKILADETICPGSYSIRTMNFLRTMSKKEAELFSKIAKYSFSLYKFDQRFIFSNEKNFNMMHTNTLELIELNDIGLVLDIGKSLHTTCSGVLTFIKQDKYYILHNNSDHEYQTPVMLFSKTGNELFKLISDDKQFSSNDYIGLLELNNNIEVTIHQLIANSDQYAITPLETIK